MENFNILSAWGFMFFLLILSIGYFIVEILFWESYFLKKVLRRNNNSVLDRFIHYIIWWIFGNIVFVTLLYYTKSHIDFLEVFDISGKLAQEFEKVFSINPMSFQLIYFSIFYFISFVVIVFVFRFAIPYALDKFFSKIIDLNSRKKKKTKKKKNILK